MLARANRLFYVHLNDNDKFWDWDMLPGVYNFWDFIEFFYYLRKLGYDDWFAFDIFPKESRTEDAFSVSFGIANKLIEFSNRLDDKQVERLLEKRDPVESAEYLFSLM